MVRTADALGIAIRGCARAALVYVAKRLSRLYLVERRSVVVLITLLLSLCRVPSAAARPATGPNGGDRLETLVVAGLAAAVGNHRADHHRMAVLLHRALPLVSVRAALVSAPLARSSHRSLFDAHAVSACCCSACVAPGRCWPALPGSACGSG